MTNQLKRAARVRAKIRAVSRYPRLSVTRSSRHISAQIIDDKQGKTLVSASSLTLSKDKKIGEGTKSDLAAAVGTEIAELAKKQKLTQVVFDRGSYRYHGRVRALAEAARQGGLKF